MNNSIAYIFRALRTKLPMIRQAQNTECGHACVVMLANYLGHDIDLISLRQVFEPSGNGCTMLDIVEMFESLDLKPRALKVDIDVLSKIKYPAIIHWNMNHFVVLKKIALFF